MPVLTTINLSNPEQLTMRIEDTPFTHLTIEDSQWKEVESIIIAADPPVLRAIMLTIARYLKKREEDSLALF